VGFKQIKNMQPEKGSDYSSPVTGSSPLAHHLPPHNFQSGCRHPEQVYRLVYDRFSSWESGARRRDVGQELFSVGEEKRETSMFVLYSFFLNVTLNTT
jgi:hypothetical protein